MKYLITHALLCFAVFTAFAQNRISGSVTDQSTGEVLPFVNISVQNTTIGTTSGVDGNFTIETPNANDSLVFTFIGYAAKTIIAPLGGFVNVSLETDVNQLNEVVITALGIEREKRALGYVVQKIESKELTSVKSANFLDNLSGKLAGVTVTQGATGVGSSSKIVIRGENSFTNNNPLFVVDGTIINNNSIINNANEAASGFQSVDFGNGAMEVNADDIESLSVLKGPSAAALYGTRASNGVIIINTKDGSNTKGMGVSFSSSTFFDRPFRLPDFQNKYGQGNSGQFAFKDGLGGGVNDLISYSYGQELDAGNFTPQFDSPVTLPDGTVVRGGDVAVHGGLPITATELKSYPDNLKDFYQTGVTTTNNVAISSGNDKGSFRLSFTDLQSESFIPGVNLDRKTLSGRFTFTPTDKLKIASSFSYINSTSDNRPSSGYGSENIGYSLVAWGPRSLNIAALQDYWQPGLEGVQQYSFNYTYFDNPYFTLLENRNSFNRNRIYGNISATYQFDEKYSLSVRSGTDLSNESRELLRAFSSNRFKSGAYAENTVFYKETNTDVLFTRKENYGNFSTVFSVGGNRLDQTASFNQTQANSLAQPGIFQLSNASSALEVTTREAGKRINSMYAFTKFGYKNFLYLDITGRNDWSSALATPTSVSGTSFFYPSASSSLVLSQIVDLPKAISFAQVRASVAQVGNDTDPYQTSTAYVAQTPFLSQPTLSEQTTLSNSNLVPERTTSVEFGADVRLYRDRVGFDVTYYNATTENQIIALPIALSSGYTQQVLNGSQVKSKGLEVITTFSAIKKDDFSWTSQLNFSRNVSVVNDLPEGIDKLTLGYSRVYDNPNQTVYAQVEEGGRIGDLYGTGYMKTDDGQFILDENGNFIVDNNLQKLGNYNPDFILGFNNQFKYKNFDVGFLIDWRQGGILVSRTLALAGVAGQLKETENRPDDGIVAEGVTNTGTAENPVYTQNTKAISAESYYRQYYDRNHEENNTYDGSYLKLRQFSIGYTFDTNNNRRQWVRNLSNLNLSLIGRNIFAISAVKHVDPEQLSLQGNSFVSGVEDISYPTARSIGVKLSVNL